MRIKHPKGEEFEARQLCLDWIARADRVVMHTLSALRKSLRAWEKPARIARAALARYVLPLFGDNNGAPGTPTCHQSPRSA